MNDAVIIVTVVLFVGIVATVVFVIWRTRYQPVENPFRTHNDSPPPEQVVIRESDFRPGAAGSRRTTGEAKHASTTGNDPGDLLLPGLAIGHIASVLHTSDDPTPPSPRPADDHPATGGSSRLANDPFSGPFSSDPGISSDSGGDSSGGESGDSGGGSE